LWVVSPVIKPSSSSDLPEITVPSAGTVRPGAPAAVARLSAATGTVTPSPPDSKAWATYAFSAARLPATARVLRRMAWSR
jgi:hypothetical protein